MSYEHFPSKNSTLVNVTWRKSSGDVELVVIDDASDQPMYSILLDRKVARSLGYAIVETAAGPA